MRAVQSLKSLKVSGKVSRAYPARETFILGGFRAYKKSQLYNEVKHPSLNILYSKTSKSSQNYSYYFIDPLAIFSPPAINHSLCRPKAPHFGPKQTDI